MKLRRTIKPNLKSPKRYWKPKEFELESICMPDTPKLERPMIIWSQNYPNFSDSMCFDYDTLEPSEFMVNLLYLTKLNQDSIYKCVMAVMESSSGHTHVLVKIDNSTLKPSNYKKIYKQIAEKLGSNYDSKCCDPFRGFFYPNRIVFTNFNCENFVYNPDLYIPEPVSPSPIKAINTLMCDTSKFFDPEIGEFVKGNRNQFLFKTLCKMIREKQDWGGWMEEFAYPYIEEDFPKEEVDGIIKWIRKSYKKFHYMVIGRQKKYERIFETYRQLRIEGKTHQEAYLSVNPTMSMPTQKRYRARFNKEMGITEMRGGKIGRSWKSKEKEANDE